MVPFALVIVLHFSLGEYPIDPYTMLAECLRRARDHSHQHCQHVLVLGVKVLAVEVTAAGTL